eukprot:2318302-Alexandrium_andersonii.AAC.1
MARATLDKGYDLKGIWGTRAGPLGHPEVSTRGLDDLQQRAAECYQKGIRFAKWRAVIQLDPDLGIPALPATTDAAHLLARFASICQSESVVPVLVVELAPDGSHNH